ncbi:hypothetical protein XBJ2_1200002 [Xenorhabdus bovienii str. Jollieti]|uniref:Uncharacterized protein n=1 Tax=Xenorhabdus bovienii (strain SS-2004) TaxID=406818 RepID=D3V111_XENBS|nr:hypothetical protein XBJ1_2158 [Xenorhabdus bovienii SS-2004]CDH27079.1 hypothetical protein XBJ2_1200002 [Xenorhabdus bovienii str. Jollieti]
MVTGSSTGDNSLELKNPPVLAEIRECILVIDLYHGSKIALSKWLSGFFQLCFDFIVLVKDLRCETFPERGFFIVLSLIMIFLV